MPSDPRASSCSAQSEAGFTLVEILVVVFIVALMSAVVVVNLPAPKPAGLVRADEIARDLRRASQEAIISGEPIALSILDGRYRFERYRAGFWSPAGAVSAGREASTGRVSVEIIRDDAGNRRRNAPQDRTGDTTAEFERQLVFSPVGDATPARVIISGSGDEWVIRVTASGDVQREGVDQGSVRRR
ncbi:MAG: GspH/FimT family pseudopilin [Pseudomonadota bacterium]